MVVAPTNLTLTLSDTEGFRTFTPTSLTQLILKVQRGLVWSSRKPFNQSDIVPWCALWAYGSVGTDISLSVDSLLVLKYDGLVYTTHPI